MWLKETIFIYSKTVATLEQKYRDYDIKNQALFQFRKCTLGSAYNIGNTCDIF